MDIVEYLDEAGESPFGNWFSKIESQAALKVRRSIARMEAGNFGDARGVGKGVFECRINFGAGYRIYYGRDGHALVILLVGGTKKRQQADIDRAQGYWADYRARKTVR
jgi:putative addiction module killer protein